MKQRAVVLFQDLRRGIRALSASPGFTLAAVLVLSLGIGANTAIFSVVKVALLDKLPVREPGRLFSYGRVLERVRVLPGVRSAGLTSSLPLGGNYFRTLQIPLVRGRYFEPQDKEGSQPVVIINETTARRFFRGQDPIGKHVMLLSRGDPTVYFTRPLSLTLLLMAAGLVVIVALPQISRTREEAFHEVD